GARQKHLGGKRSGYHVAVSAGNGQWVGNSGGSAQGVQRGAMYDRAHAYAYDTSRLAPGGAVPSGAAGAHMGTQAAGKGGYKTAPGAPAIAYPSGTAGSAPVRVLGGKGYTHTARSVAHRPRSAASPEAQDPNAFRDAGSSILSMNGDWLRYAGGTQTPDGKWHMARANGRNSALVGLQQSFMSGEFQETTRRGLARQGIPINARNIGRYAGFALSGAQTTDAAINREGSHAFFEEQVRGLRSRRFLRGKENDPLAALDADRRFNPESPYHGSRMTAQAFGALRSGGLNAWRLDEAQKTREGQRDNGIRTAALAAGAAHMGSGNRFDESFYGRVIQLEETRRGIWKELDGLFRHDPAQANAEATTRYADAVARLNTEEAQSIAVRRRVREQEENDQSAIRESRLGVLRGGGTQEAAAREQAGVAKGLEVFDFESRNGRSPEEAAWMAEGARQGEIVRQEQDAAAENFARMNAELKNLPRALADLYGATGLAARAFDLFDSETGRGLTPGQRSEMLSGMIGQDRARAEYGLGAERAGIGARNDAERAQRDLDYWRQNGRGELEKSLLKNPAIDATTRENILGHEEWRKQLEVERGGLEGQRWGVDAVQSGERAAAQSRIQMQSALAFTDAQKEAVYLEEATLDAKMRGLQIDEDTLDVLRGQARERVKQDNAFKRFEVLDKAFKGMESTVQSAMEGLVAGRDPLRKQGARDEAYRWGQQAMDLRERGFAEDSPEYRNASKRHRELEKASRPSSRLGDFKDTLFGGFGDSARGAASGALSNAAWGWLGQKIGGPLFGQGGGGVAGGMPGGTPGINAGGGGLGGVLGSVAGALFGAGGGAGAPFAAQATMAVQNMTVQAQSVTINAGSVNVSGSPMGGILGGSGGPSMQQTAVSMATNFLVARGRG
ncbi:MAG TPA: hypothetical protein VNM48_08035, partial [Chloroflexota bacterium]|nr:hypothetical protein [Chloroflexota bacterium]